jgi:CBS domain-containing protein
MQISEVMTEGVRYVDPNTPIREIAKEMRDNDFGSVPIADEERLVGMVTDRDIVVRGIAQGLDATAPSSQVMSPNVLYCFEDDTVEAVLKNMGANQVRRLPVVNREKRLVGVVSLGDLSKAAGQSPSGSALKKISQPGQFESDDRDE